MRRKCSFNNSIVDCVYGGSSCPAESAIHLCNALQVYFMGTKYEHIRDNFESQLQDELTRAAYRCFVFWTPEGEKVSGSSKTMGRVRESEWYNRTDFHKYLNDVLLKLNNTLHSHDFLRRLVDSTESAKSRVFRISMSEDAIRFRAYFPDTEKAIVNEFAGICDLEVPIPLPAQGSPVHLLARLKREKLSPPRLFEVVEAYIDNWELVAPNISISVNKTRKPEDPLDLEDAKTLQDLWTKSVKHIALMALFSELNSFKSVTYYLSPLDREELKSSMVIYWKGQEPGRSYHYLLQMLLGLNAAPVLLQEQESQKREQLLEARKMALVHYGHTFKNRIQGHLANLIDEGAPIHQINTAESLLEFSQILELNVVDNFEDLLAMPKTKRDRFISSRSDGPWDILRNIREHWLKEWMQFSVRTSFEEGQENNKCWVAPDAEISITKCLLGHPKTSDYRLANPIYQQLFGELLLNASRYSHYSDSSDMHNGLPVRIYRIFLDSAIHEDHQLLVITNFCAAKRNTEGHLQTIKELTEFRISPEWNVWPESLKFDGPGMAVELLRRLGLGELYYQTWKNSDGWQYFSVGVWLAGLEIE